MGPVVGLKRSLAQVFVLALALQAVAIVSPFYMQWAIDGAVVSGDRDIVHAVTSFLATRQVIAHELRVEQATLDDAFIALTGRRLEPAAATEA